MSTKRSWRSRMRCERPADSTIEESASSTRQHDLILVTNRLPGSERALAAFVRAGRTGFLRVMIAAPQARRGNARPTRLRRGLRSTVPVRDTSYADQRSVEPNGDGWIWNSSQVYSTRHQSHQGYL
jgi:hypothetical protein